MLVKAKALDLLKCLVVLKCKKQFKKLMAQVLIDELTVNEAKPQEKKSGGGGGR